MTIQNIDSAVPEQSRRNNQGQVTGTATPAEDEEEQRALDSLWELKEDAKWGKDGDTQKKAIRDLTRIGTPALSPLTEILLVLPPGEIKDYCQDAINKINNLHLSEMKKNVPTVK
jgi:hypothetical protein